MIPSIFLQMFFPVKCREFFLSYTLKDLVDVYEMVIWIHVCMKFLWRKLLSLLKDGSPLQHKISKIYFPFFSSKIWRRKKVPKIFGAILWYLIPPNAPCFWCFYKLCLKREYLFFHRTTVLQSMLLGIDVNRHKVSFSLSLWFFCYL